MTISMAAVGLLDFGVAHNGESPRDIVDHTIEAARRADALGFGRYWLAEHQTGACCWASPELVLALIARDTTRIRVGSGGVLVATHNALRVANDFSLLAQLYPDRIDIGLARGTPGENSLALVEPLAYVPGSVDDFSRKLVALISYLRAIPRPQHAYFRARAFPLPTRLPEIWILGSGGTSGVFAAQYGLPFAQSMFHFPNTTLAALATYCRDFRPSTWAPEPRTMVAIAGVCAETRARAQAIAASQPNKAITLNVVGTAADWCDYVAEMVSIAGVHEVMYFEASPLPAQRLRAYELLAGALAETSPRAAGTLGRPVDTMHSYSTQA
jgi:luciferase family oxidoreductase group 1